MTWLLERRVYFFSVGFLIALRFAAGAVLPLSADEAYYWLWSKHLAAGYYDHPPAIAFLIRTGVTLFGDTPFGVRAAPLLLSAATSWLVWRAGALILKSERAGAHACLLFNLTLMIAVETVAATPDAPLIACSAVVLFGLGNLEDSGDSRWWLVAGAAAGLALLSKYTAFFVGLGAMAWMIFAPQARRWWLSPLPYLGAALAFLIFLPNLLWNADHGWITFAFQFGRIGQGHLTFRFLAELIGAQLLLATPFIFVSGIFGLLRAKSSLPAMSIWPAAIYFVVHSLHDRVQGNWPCFLYPALVIAAVQAMRATNWKGWISGAAHWSRRLAIPVAFTLLALCYLQAFFAVLPIGRSDPFARLLGFGIADVARTLESRGASAVLTTNYEATSWLAFYGHLPVIQLNEENRWPVAPRPPADLLDRPLLYVTELKRDRHDLVATRFRRVALLGSVDRMRSGRPIERYLVYGVSGARSLAVGRIP
jgi:4-amino-4-deoxy-L-arabinose transferase-like glycosyltransferase